MLKALYKLPIYDLGSVIREPKPNYYRRRGLGERHVRLSVGYIPSKSALELAITSSTCSSGPFSSWALACIASEGFWVLLGEWEG